MELESKNGTIYGTITKSHEISFPDYKHGNGYGFFAITRPERKLLCDGAHYIRQPAYPITLKTVFWVYNR